MKIQTALLITSVENAVRVYGFTCALFLAKIHFFFSSRAILISSRVRIDMTDSNIQFYNGILFFCLFILKIESFQCEIDCL